jgi:hypothetical protein
LDGWFHAKRHLGAVGHGFSAQLVDVGLVAVLDFDFILNVRKRETGEKVGNERRKKESVVLVKYIQKSKAILGG